VTFGRFGIFEDFNFLTFSRFDFMTLRRFDVLVRSRLDVFLYLDFSMLMRRFDFLTF